MEAERERLYENQKSLENIHRYYQNKRKNLLEETDMLSVYTRQLGYGRESEEFIRIMGLNPAINTEMPAGNVLFATSYTNLGDRQIKIISIVFGFIVLVFYVIMNFYPTREMSRG
jgi:hypothetical protein